GRTASGRQHAVAIDLIVFERAARWALAVGGDRLVAGAPLAGVGAAPFDRLPRQPRGSAHPVNAAQRGRRSDPRVADVVLDELADAINRRPARIVEGHDAVR